MFLDLDRFKNINDAHGHATGDVALKAIAHRLLQHVRDEDTVCRNGGDEFLYLLMNPISRKNIARIAVSVLKSIAQPVAVAGAEFVIKPSIGIAIYPHHGTTGDQLITNADGAMRTARRTARARHRVLRIAGKSRLVLSAIPSGAVLVAAALFVMRVWVTEQTPSRNRGRLSEITPAGSRRRMELYRCYAA